VRVDLPKVTLDEVSTFLSETQDTYVNFGCHNFHVRCTMIEHTSSCFADHHFVGTDAYCVTEDDLDVDSVFDLIGVSRS